MKKEVDVNELYEQRKTELRKMIIEAQKNRKIKPRTIEEEVTDIQEINLEEKKDFGEFICQKHEVCTKNAHEYLLLLGMYFESCIDYEEINDKTEFIKQHQYHYQKFVDDIVYENLKHEYEHHVPGLDQDNLEIFYGIAFYTDLNSEDYWHPFINFTGFTTMRIYLDMLISPNELSIGDKNIMKKYGLL